MIYYNSADHKEQRVNVKPLSLEEMETIKRHLNAFLPIETKVFDLFQRFIWDYENLSHMRETQPKWIDADVNLPEIGIVVLLSSNFKRYMTGYYDGFNFISMDYRYDEPAICELITHWIPIIHPKK